jgi:hypothetical protein
VCVVLFTSDFFVLIGVEVALERKKAHPLLDHPPVNHHHHHHHHNPLLTTYHQTVSNLLISSSSRSLRLKST